MSHRLQAQSYHHATYSEVSVKVACWSTTPTDCSYRANSMLLILMEVPVKVACQSMTATKCRHRAITMLLILVEVSVKVACQSTRATNCSYRELSPCHYLWKWLVSPLQPQTAAIELLPCYLLILLENSVKKACWSMTATNCKHRAITMLPILVEVSVKVACGSTTSTDFS